MKIFVAAPYPWRKSLAQDAANACTMAGHDVVSAWIFHQNLTQLEDANMDATGVEACDVLLYLASKEARAGGRAWECGYAHALGKRILVVGMPDHVHMHRYPRFSSVEEALCEL